MHLQEFSFSEKTLFKFATIGNVDDGKSTLIGRLLFDSKNISDDQLSSLQSATKRRGETQLNLSLLTDGLRAEREQGITIDVAHKYFSTSKRKFIIADCPGHFQYTRNMVTGTSNSHAAVLLVDARFGISDQTKRHALICSMMGVQSLIVCVNKMDLVNYSEETYRSIQDMFFSHSSQLLIRNISFVPISALHGDNVVQKSENMSWYQGAPLLSILEALPNCDEDESDSVRFFVQRVIRPNTANWHDFRGYAGRIDSGTLSKGQEVRILPSGSLTKVRSIFWKEKEIQKASAKMSVVITLEDELDLSRGDIVVSNFDVPEIKYEFDATICWLAQKPLSLNTNFYLRQSTNETLVSISSIHFTYDVKTLDKQVNSPSIATNDLASVNICSSKPIFFESYKQNKDTGSFILIDPISNNTVAAGTL